ncbi:arylesterase [Kordiimonas sp.]|uniref:arylesterase n=1 Tax=Kordiimonas sp. TaxID=1970157 RepID=UPI003A8E581C
MMVNHRPINKVISAFFARCLALLTIFGFGLQISATTVKADEGDVVQILAFGDSLTAGYGLAPGEGFTEQLEVWLNENAEVAIEVINAGVSGDTSSGGRARLEWGLAPVKDGRPDLVILELGANDGLRGIDPHITAENIDAMAATLAERDIPVLIAGMMAPPNLGADYAAVFNPIFPETAEKYGFPLYPFFLDGVAADASLNQSDGMHPTAEGVKIIVEKIGPVVLEVLGF